MLKPAISSYFTRFYILSHANKSPYSSSSQTITSKLFQYLKKSENFDKSNTFILELQHGIQETFHGDTIKEVPS